MKVDVLAAAALAAGLLTIARAMPAAREKAAIASVTIPSGTIVGSVGSAVDSFKGIPYADAPTGNLRFRPPVKLSRHLGTFDATAVAASCPQGPILSLSSLSGGAAVTAASILKSAAGVSAAAAISEDCLTISVQRPNGVNASAALPVLFWIHGGGFAIGSTSGVDGTRLIETGVLHGQPFIFVAVNYRVGGWGFMPGEEILDEGSGNAGLLDQRMGLEWVADNIAAFGGDADKVTIWGESAGAISVFDHLVLYDGNATYNGKPLFRGAIMNSGSAAPTDPLDGLKGQAVYNSVVTAAGCDGQSDTLACLRGLGNDEFTAAANSVPGLVSYQSLALSYLPRPDGKALTDSPDALARAGKFHHVPMIIGTQEDEGTLFSLTQRDMGTTAKIVSYLSEFYFHNANTSQITELVDTYSPLAWDGSPFRTGINFEFYPGKKRLAAILGDIVFNLVRRISLQIFADVSPDVPLWSYFSSYNYNPVIGLFGTAHGSDIPVLFSQSSSRYPTISGRTYYINFLYNLDPNSGTQLDVFWPEWTVGNKLLRFDANSNSLLDDTYRQSSYEYLRNNIDSLRF